MKESRLALKKNTGKYRKYQIIKKQIKAWQTKDKIRKQLKARGHKH